MKRRGIHGIDIIEDASMKKILCARDGIYLTALAVTTLFVASCGTFPTVPLVEESPMPLSNPRVALQPGDTVEVKFRYWPEMNELQTVRDDGMIMLQIVDAVQAAGLTPDELRRDLLLMYARELKEPEITVIARPELNRQVYVAGMVHTPGTVPLKMRMTPMEAIGAAGGFAPHRAKIRRVLVVRRLDGKQYGRTVNLRRAFKDPERDAFLLEAGDVIYVPCTNIERLNVWVEMYINNMIPRGVYYDLNDLLDDDETATGTRTTYTLGPGGPSLNVIR